MIAQCGRVTGGVSCACVVVYTWVRCVVDSVVDGVVGVVVEAVGLKEESTATVDAMLRVRWCLYDAEAGDLRYG